MSTDLKSAKPAAARWPIWSLAGTILLSAFLLFQVQPLVSKCILPWFGGCPAVWTACMLFFQTLLFGGYVYAHLLQRWLAPRGQAAVHLALAAAALLAMPVAPGAGWKPTDSDHPTWQIFVLLTATVGLPYFVLSATSPLVQAWFSRSFPGRSPYRLYALSNFGSLVALLSYPFLFEPALDLTSQSLLWSAAFAFYAALCGVCLVCLWRLRRAEPQAGAAGALGADPPTDPAPPAPLHRVLWLLLPACGSLMLLATTNHVCQDVAVVPLLWVVPLALYLLSFIVCFDHQRWYVRRLWTVLTLLAIMGVAIEETSDWRWMVRQSAVGQWIIEVVGDDAFTAVVGPHGFAEQSVLYFATLFFACMVCHGELVRLRPHPRHLTEFYLLIAAGGALGGALVSLAAPSLFATFVEWPIGLAVCYGIAAAALGLGGVRGKARLARGVALTLLTAGLACVLVCQWKKSEVIDGARNFYGVISVAEENKTDPGQRQFSLQHGRIIHGRQFTDPEKSRWPTTYYSDQSGVGRAIRWFRDRGNVRVGAVGLGVGTLATYARPGDRYQFYEINPAVRRMAETYFTYLRDCRGDCTVVMGDARLSLERQAPQHFDVLVLDAFSGDAIPTHLLTQEAFEVYQRHRAAGGVIAVHISNKYLYLAPVVAGLAEHFGLKTRRAYTQEEDKKRLIYRADWMLLSDNNEFLEAVPPTPPEHVHDDFRVPLWTDQYSNLFQILQ